MADSSLRRHLLIALDSSETSKYALKWTIDKVIRSGDYLVLLSAVGKDDYEGSAALWGDSGSPYIPLEEFDVVKKYNLFDENTMAELRKVAKEKQVEIVGQIHYGDPREKIVEASQQINTDLLIIGSRGLGTVKRVLLGSVSLYVVQHATCPVTIVKKP